MPLTSAGCGQLPLCAKACNLENLNEFMQKNTQLFCGISFSF